MCELLTYHFNFRGLFMNKDIKIIASRMKELIKEQRLTQKTLAQRSGISAITITRLMKCKCKNPTNDTIEKIAGVLGVCRDYLTGVTDYKNYDSWIDMHSKYTLDANKEKTLLEMLISWGYSAEIKTNDIILITCPTGEKRVLHKKHLEYLLHNFFTLFDSIIFPLDLIPAESAENIIKS